MLVLNASKLSTISFLLSSLIQGLGSLSLGHQDVKNSCYKKQPSIYSSRGLQLSAGATATARDGPDQGEILYRISGLSCNKCVQKIHSALCSYDSGVTVTLKPPTLNISRNIPSDLVRKVVKQVGKSYEVHKVRWRELDVYFPVVSIHLLILCATIFSLLRAYVFNYHTFMRNYMAGYLIVFSLFKAIDLDGFVRSFQQYDIIAKRYRVYGFLYPFIQLLLGVMYSFNILPVASNVFTAALKSISAYGIWTALRSSNSRRLTCACLGSTFRIPISYLSFAEDVAMIAMAVISILHR